jgi:hypothetical protein
MHTTCIIVASSVIGGSCIIMGFCCCFYTNKPSNNITPVTETVTITREHYNTLKNYIQNENASLPEYVETIEPPPIEPPPEYIIAERIIE